MSNKKALMEIGFDNIVMRQRIIAIVNAQTKPIKKALEIARRDNKVIDATSGRKTRAVIITDSGHLVLSALQPKTLAMRLKS